MKHVLWNALLSAYYDACSMIMSSCLIWCSHISSSGIFSLIGAPRKCYLTGMVSSCRRAVVKCCLGRGSGERALRNQNVKVSGKRTWLRGKACGTPHAAWSYGYRRAHPIFVTLHMEHAKQDAFLPGLIWLCVGGEGNSLYWVYFLKFCPLYEHICKFSL